MHPDVLEDEILTAIRRIVRAVDLHSRTLIRGHHVSGPQLVALRELARLGPVGVGAHARAINLSQPTVTGILNRMERAGLVRRERSASDRRSVICTLTTRGAEVLREAPSPLQDRFLEELKRLADWERTQMLATLERIASLMDAESLPAAPVLTTEALAPAEEALVAEADSGPEPADHPTSSQREESA